MLSQLLPALGKTGAKTSATSSSINFVTALIRIALQGDARGRTDKHQIAIDNLSKEYTHQANRYTSPMRDAADVVVLLSLFCRFKRDCTRRMAPRAVPEKLISRSRKPGLFEFKLEPSINLCYDFAHLV